MAAILHQEMFIHEAHVFTTRLSTNTTVLDSSLPLFVSVKGEAGEGGSLKLLAGNTKPYVYNVGSAAPIWNERRGWMEGEGFDGLVIHVPDELVEE